MCCSAGAKSGTSTEGKQVRLFFSIECTPVLKDLLSKRHNLKHQENTLKLHSQLSIALRVISCSRRINVKEFDNHCKETMMTICNHFPWVRQNITQHGAIQSSAELN